MKLTAVIEQSSDKFFSIYTQDSSLEWVFGGYGASVEKAMQDYMASIEEMRNLAKEEGKSFPEEVEIQFRYDIPSFFNYFDWINISAFAKKAGINESKMRAYKTGAVSPSKATLDKIQATIKAMSGQMACVSL